MNIWFVAAGTGGHIFPGIALANEIKKSHPEAEFLFFGTKDRLESKLVPRAGYPIQFLRVTQWKGQNPLLRVAALFYLALGFAHVLRLLAARKPDALISVGGYVSMPTALACRCFGVPVILLEPNIRAGLSNRILSHLAVKAFCPPGSDALTRFACPTEDAGNPVREDLHPVPVREHAAKILVLGGSQGALSLCKASLAVARDLNLKTRGFELTLQCGDKNLAQSQAWAKEFGVSEAVKIKPFIDDIPAALDEADLIVARAGAMTIAELSVAGLPTIFVPFPNAADDHQRVNARVLTGAEAAYMVDERDGNLEMMLYAKIHELTLDAGQFQKRVELSENFKRQSRPRATQGIAKQILSLIESRG